ncbi:MAG: ZIP family metal transporter [Candidatus Woesearchaeota archaeon]
MTTYQIWLYTLTSVFIVSLIAFIGIFTLALKNKVLQKILLLLVSFATGALLGDVFIHLLPELIEEQGLTLKNSLFILLGIFLFFILEKFLCWRHCHIPTSKEHPHPLGFMNLIGDAFHNFLDGMIIAGSYLVNIQVGIATTIAVLLHEIPQEISELGVLLHAGLSKTKALLYNFLSALTSFLGAILVLILGEKIDFLISLIVPITIGGFLYIASSDLIPELHKETEPKKSLLQMIFMILGISIMLSLLLLE